jgi:hypothetical protein
MGARRGRWQPSMVTANMLFLLLLKESVALS